MPYRLNLLGPPGIQNPDGDPLDFPLGKPFALLAYLALTEHAVTRERLAELLWTGSDDRRGRISVRQALWFLRKELGPELFASDDPVALHSAWVVTDVAELEDALAACDLDRARMLWRGPLLDCFALPDAPVWTRAIEQSRSNLEHRFASALVEGAARARARGDFERALELYGRAAEIQPEREAVRVEQIELLLDARRFDEAEVALLRMRHELDDDDARRAADELLERLHQLRSIKPVHDPGTGVHLEFVGRAAELAVLLAHWRSARSGSGRVAIITGPPGIGKTRLAREAAAAAGQQGGRVIAVKAVAAERKVKWAVAGDLVRKLLPLPGAAGVSEASDTELRALVPSMARSGANGSSRTVHPGALADALRDLISAVAFESPLFMILDDLQWMDEASRGVLVHVARQLGSEPCLLAFTCRSGERDLAVDRSILALLSVPHAVNRQLAPLSEGEVAELLSLAAEFEEEAESNQAAARIHDLTGGNPLFVVELLRMLEDRGRLVVADDGRYRFAAGAFAGNLPLPETLLETLGARLEGLSEDAAAVVTALAATGAPLPMGQLARSLRLEQGKLARAVAELLARELVEWASPEDLSLAHDALQAAVRERFGSQSGMMPPARRWLWTGGIAAAILLLTSAVIFRSRAAPEPLPFGGGRLYIETVDTLLEVVPEPSTSLGWRVRPPTVWQPQERGVYRRGPYLLADGGIRWYGARTNQYDAPDIIEYLPDGGTRVLVARPGDDDFGSPSPDGRFIAYRSENLSTEVYDKDLYVADSSGGGARRVVATGALAFGPEWSPDGRWLAALIAANPDTVLVVTPHGDRVESFALSRARLQGWCGLTSSILALTGTGPVRELHLLDPEGGGRRTIVSDTAIASATCSPDGTAVAYGAIRDGRRVLLLRNIEDGQVQRIHVPVSLQGLSLRWNPDALPPVVTGVRIVQAPGKLAWGDRAHLAAEVSYSDSSIRSGPVRWQSTDPSIASVLPEDRLSGNRAGETRLIASVHDWLADTVGVEVTGAVEADILFRDAFTALDTSRWQVLGWPPPQPRLLDGEPALELRGDGRYVDGILLKDPIRIPGGATLELDFRFRLTRKDRQRIQVLLTQAVPLPGGDRNEFHGWQRHEQVGFGYPTYELSWFDPLEAAFGTAEFSSSIELPGSFSPDRWHHLAIQLRADGRGFLYIDRKFVAATLLRAHNGPDAEWRIAILGAAADTRLFLRSLALWPGMRYEVPEGI